MVNFRRQGVRRILPAMLGLPGEARRVQVQLAAVRPRVVEFVAQPTCARS